VAAAHEGLTLSIDMKKLAKIAGVGVPAVAAAMISTPLALADPEIPVPPPPPPPADAVAPVAAPADPVAAPVEVPHLPSPENLPPGTVDEPVVAESPRMEYLRGLWQAIRTDDLTWQDGLLMLTQRPMDPNTAPPPGVPAGPQPQGPQPAAPPPAEPLPPAPAPAEQVPPAPVPAPAPLP
jgi:hypothetical protein